MWDIVRALVADGMTILLTTQYLDEADQLADRIAVLDGGTLVAHGNAARAQTAGARRRIRLQFADPVRAADARPAPGRAGRTRPDPARTAPVQSPGDGSVAALRTLLDRLDDAPIDRRRADRAHPDLDDVFLALTGQHRRRRRCPCHDHR